MPNLALYWYGSMYGLGILWSIGAEEQFYLVWPHIAKYVKAKHFLTSLFIILALIYLIKTPAYLIHVNEWGFPKPIVKISRIIYLILQYDCMIIGAIIATLFHQKHKILIKLYHPATQLLALLIIALFMLSHLEVGPFSNLLVAPMYGILILNLSTNQKSLFSLENRLLNSLGQISYGIYMYHTIFIGLMLYCTTHLMSLNTLTSNIILYAGTWVLTLGTAYVSFHYLEKPILRYKEKFMVVKSTH